MEHATRFARAFVEERAPGTDRLIVWRTGFPNRERTSRDRLPPVGPFHFGIKASDAKDRGVTFGFAGSPFRRGRRTVNALDRRMPGQSSQDTHDRHYVLVDERVQADAVESQTYRAAPSRRTDTGKREHKGHVV